MRSRMRTARPDEHSARSSNKYKASHGQSRVSGMQNDARSRLTAMLPLATKRALRHTRSAADYRTTNT
jgi:hypothetical protein